MRQISLISILACTALVSCHQFQSVDGDRTSSLPSNPSVHITDSGSDALSQNTTASDLYVLAPTHTGFALKYATGNNVIVPDLGELLHQQIPDYEELASAQFLLVGAPKGSANVYFLVMPTEPADDPFAFLLFRFNVHTKLFTQLDSSILFGLQYSQEWRITPDRAALIWIPRGPDGIQKATEGNAVYEPRTMYLVDLEKDSFETLVTLPKNESFNAISPEHYLTESMKFSISDDGLVHYTVFSIPKRNSVFSEPIVDPQDPAVQMKFESISLGDRTIQTGHGLH